MAQAASFSDDAFASKVRRVRGVMFDIDGCLIISDGPAGLGGSPLPGAIEAVQAVRDAGLPLVIFTNGSMQTPAEIAQNLRTMGFTIADEEVFTPAVVAAQVLELHHGDQPLLVFGGDGVQIPFKKRGLNVLDLAECRDGLPVTPAAVVIGWDSDFGYAKAQLASEAIFAGATLYCTSFASYFASEDRLNVGISGFITAGLVHVTGAEAHVVGKPSAAAISSISDVMGVAPEELLIIGDDLDAEARMAVNAGGVGCIVTTGTATRERAENAPAACTPDCIVDSMYEFVDIFSPLLGTTTKLTSS